MFSNLRRKAAGLVVVGGIFVAGGGLMIAVDTATAAPASADVTNPGDNTSCTAGTDHCSGWLPSAAYSCVVYNVLWDHLWSGAPGGEAFWRITVDQWWACSDQGGVHKIGNVTTYDTLDAVIPHNQVVGSQGKIELAPDSWSAYFGDSTAPVYSFCNPVGWHSDSAYVYSSNQTSGVYTAGNISTTVRCLDWTHSVVRNVTFPGVTYNGSFMTWFHYNRYSSDGNPHTFTLFNLA